MNLHCRIPYSFIRGLFILKRFFLIGILVSCGETVHSTAGVEPGLRGLYILNEGLWGSPQTSELKVLTHSTEVEDSVYQRLADEFLGDTPNHLHQFGNRLFIVVNSSHLIRVIDLVNMTKINDILIQDESGQGQFPRKIVVISEDIGYVTCSGDNSVKKIDLVNYDIVESTSVGGAPEDILYIDNRLYVACGGWGYDNRIFVLYASSGAIQTTLTADYNVWTLASDQMYLYAGALLVYGGGANNSKIYKYTLSDLSLVDSVAFTGGVEQLLVSGKDLYIKNDKLYKIDSDSLGTTPFLLVDEADFYINSIYMDNDFRLWTAEYQDYVSAGRLVHRELDGSLVDTYPMSIGPRSMLKVGD